MLRFLDLKNKLQAEIYWWGSRPLKTIKYVPKPCLPWGNLKNDTEGEVLGHILEFWAMGPPQTWRSRPEVYFLGPKTSKSRFPDQKISKIPPRLKKVRFTIEHPEPNPWLGTDSY